MLKLGYGIKGISGTIFENVESESEAITFLRCGKEIAYAFIVDKTGEAIDLIIGNDVTWEQKFGN